MYLCCVESLSFNFLSYSHFMKMLKIIKIPKAIAHVFFFKKWLRNHPQFLLHFLIHIDVLKLCRKFELIPTNNFIDVTISLGQ